MNPKVYNEPYREMFNGSNLIISCSHQTETIENIERDNLKVILSTSNVTHNSKRGCSRSD